MAFNIFLIPLSARAQKQNSPEPLNGDRPPESHNAIEQLPEFPGGQKAFYKFLAENLKWPSDSMDDTFGRVIVSFYIETDGQLTGLKIANSLAPKFDLEALRVMRKSPRWIPAMIKNKPVRVAYMVSIKFELTK